MAENKTKPTDASVEDARTSRRCVERPARNSKNRGDMPRGLCYRRCGGRALSATVLTATQWLYELKLDGYRAIAFKRDGVVHLRSRNDNDFSGRYPGVVKGLAKM